MKSKPEESGKNKIRSVIVEDESRSRAALSKLLSVCCPHVEVEGMAASVKDAIRLIDDLKPQLIFLDVALPDGDGFNVLENQFISADQS